MTKEARRPERRLPSTEKQRTFALAVGLIALTSGVLRCQDEGAGAQDSGSDASDAMAADAMADSSNDASTQGDAPSVGTGDGSVDGALDGASVDGAIADAGPDGGLLTCTQCAPIVLALPGFAVQTSPRYPGTAFAVDSLTSLAVDGTNVYWAELGTDGTCGPGDASCVGGEPKARCIIRKVPKGDGLAATFDPIQSTWIPTATFSQGSVTGPSAKSPWTPLPTGEVDGGDVVTLATGNFTPYPWPTCQIAVDSGKVYWTDATAIYTVGVDGGEPTTVGTSVTNPKAIALNQEGIYWIDTTTLMKMNRDGGGAMRLGFVHPTELAVNATDAYSLGGSLEVTPLDGGATTLLASSTLPMDGLALDSNNVYWAAWGTGGSVMKAPLDGGAATTVETLVYQHPVSTGSDGQSLYVGDQVGGPLLRFPLDGGAVESISEGLSPTSMAFDDTSIFWIGGTFAQPNTLMRLPREGVNAWITVSNDYLSFAPDCGAAGPPSGQSFAVTNTGNVDLAWTAASPGIPVTVQPSSGHLARGASANVMVTLQWPPNFPQQFGPTPHIVVTTDVVNVPPRYVGVAIAPSGFVPELYGTVPCDVAVDAGTCEPVTTDDAAGFTPELVRFGTVQRNASRRWELTYGFESGDASAPTITWSSDNPSFVAAQDGDDVAITFTPTASGTQNATITGVRSGTTGGGLCTPLVIAVTGASP